MAFVSFLFPPDLYSAHSTVGIHKTIGLAEDALGVLKKELDRAIPGVPPKDRKRLPASAGGNRESKAAPPEKRLQRFYGLDGDDVYVLELPAQGKKLRILRKVPEVPSGQVSIDLHDVAEVHEVVKRHIPKKKAASRGRARSISPRSREARHTRTRKAASHSPEPAHSATKRDATILPSEASAVSGAGTSASATAVARSGAREFAGLDDAIASAIAAASLDGAPTVIPIPPLEIFSDDVLSHIRSFLTKEDARHMTVTSKSLSQHAVAERTARVTALKPDVSEEAARNILQRGEGPSKSWTPTERHHILETARYYLKHQSPEEAYLLLDKNGISFKKVLSTKSSLDSEDIPAYALLIEAAARSGRIIEAERISSHIRSLEVYDSVNRRVAEKLGDIDPDGLLPLAHARFGIISGKTGDTIDMVDLINRSAGMSEKARHQAIALMAEIPLLADEFPDFLSWKDTLLTSKHLSAAQKHQVLYRLGQVYRAQEDWDNAANYLKQMLDEADPHAPHYVDALEQLFEVNVKQEAHQKNLTMAYEALYKNRVPPARRKAFRDRIEAQYGNFEKQQELLGAGIEDAISLARYLHIEKARRALSHGKTEDAAAALDQLLDPARVSFLSEDVRQAAFRYRKMMKIQQVQNLAVTEPETARRILREVLDDDARSLSKEIPLSRAQHLKERSIAHTRLGDYTAAMNDLWQVLQIYRGQHYIDRVAWTQDIFGASFNRGYRELMTASAEATLTATQQHQLGLLQASLAVSSRQWDSAAERIATLSEGLKAGAYNKEQQAYAHLIQARLYRALKQEEDAAASYQKALDISSFLLPEDRTQAHLGLGKVYYFQNQNSRAIYHFNLVLKQGNLNRDDLIAAQSHLAYAYIGTQNPDVYLDSIELLSMALQSQEAYRAKLKPYANSELKEMNLQLARVSEKYAAQKASQYYRNLSLEHYQRAEKLAENNAEKLLIFKEKTDAQYYAYLSKRGYGNDQSAVQKYIQWPYLEIFRKSVDDTVRAQAALRIGNVSFTNEMALKYYLKAEGMREFLSAADRALLDLNRAKARYRGWGDTWDPDKVQLKIETLIQRALKSGELQNKDIFEAYMQLAKIREDSRNYVEAYKLYSKALTVEKYVQADDRMNAYLARARLDMKQRLNVVLKDYNAFFADPESLAAAQAGKSGYLNMYVHRLRQREEIKDWEGILKETTDWDQWQRGWSDELQEKNQFLMGHLDRMRSLALIHSKDPTDGFSRHAKKYLDYETLIAARTPDLAVRNFKTLENFYAILSVETWLRGNKSEAKKLFQDYQLHRLHRRSGSLPQLSFVFDAMTKLSDSPDREIIEELRKVIAGMDQVQFNKQLPEHHRIPFWNSVYTTLGNAEFADKQYQAAEKSFREALANAGHRVEAHYDVVGSSDYLKMRIGQSLYQQKNYSDAYSLLQSLKVDSLSAELQRQYREVFIEAQRRFARQERAHARTIARQQRIARVTQGIRRALPRNLLRRHRGRVTRAGRTTRGETTRRLGAETTEHTTRLPITIRTTAGGYARLLDD